MVNCQSSGWVLRACLTENAQQWWEQLFIFRGKWYILNFCFPSSLTSGHSACCCGKSSPGATRLTRTCPPWRRCSSSSRMVTAWAGPVTAPGACGRSVKLVSSQFCTWETVLGRSVTSQVTLSICILEHCTCKLYCTPHVHPSHYTCPVSWTFSIKYYRSDTWEVTEKSCKIKPWKIFEKMQF